MMLFWCPAGVIWKMKEDLSGPYPGYGFGALDAFDGYVSYRNLDEVALSREITDMRTHVDQSAPDLVITQDLGLWDDAVDDPFCPDEPWAQMQKRRCLTMLDRMWRGGLVLLPGACASENEVRVHELWDIYRPSGRKRNAGS